MIKYAKMDEDSQISVLPDGKVPEGWIEVSEEKYLESKEKQEKEWIKNLSMTRGDVFEALILAKGLSKAQLRGMIEAYETDETTKLLYLNRFDEALDFYRGYPIFDLLGEQIGITPDMWDEFFETRDWNKLVNPEYVLPNIEITEEATSNIKDVIANPED